MDFRDTPEEAKFRAELREWFEHNIPEGYNERGPSGGRDAEEVSREWARKLHEGGYAGITWPKDW